MMTLEKCPSHDELRSLSLGQLSEEESDLMLGHVQSCGTCQAELGTDDAMEDTLVRSLRDTDSDEPNYSNEAECRVAMAKALGALAAGDAVSLDDSELSQLLPKVLGDYEIVRSIGRGGMGNVYLARHQKLGRDVALKVLSSHRLLQPRMRQRFETEMRAVGQLSHPNIVTAFDAREVDDLAVLVTEYIDGLDIAQILRRTGKLSVANACEITRRTAEALSYVNEQGLVHRDVKPSNVMVSRTGEVKLLDLGLARLNLSDDNSLEMTATGQAMGTADYVAPEQVNDSRNVDIRADIYALGCTLYKMLSGRPPFPNEQYPTTFAKMTAHVAEEPSLLQSIAPEVPAGLAKIVHRMMAKSPSDRPQKPDEVATALREFAIDSKLDQLVNDAEQTPSDSDRSTAHLPMHATAPVPQSFLDRRVPILTAIAAAVLGALLGLMLGVVVTIKKPDGTSATLEVPDGARLQIGENGDAEVALGGANGAIELNAQMSEADLLQKSRQLQKLVQDKLLTPSTAIRTKYKDYVDKPRMGVNRILDNSVMLHDGAGMPRGGGSYFSFTSRSNSYNMEPDLGLSRGEFSTGFSGGDCGMVKQIETDSLKGLALSDLPAPFRDYSAGDASKEVTETGRIEQGGVYAIRSIRWGESDLVAAFQVVEIDDYGATFIWKTLKNFAVPQRRAKAKASNLLNTGQQSTDIAGSQERSHSDWKNAAAEALGEIQRGMLPRQNQKFVSRSMRANSQNNLRQLALAVLNYESAVREFPAGANLVPRSSERNWEKVKSFSWRVAILPFMNRGDLYEKYKFDEEWNSESNLELLKEMPDVFRHPTAAEGATETRYQAVWGPETIIGEEPVEINDVHDGTSQTILLVEAHKGIPWTKPDDIYPDGVIEMLLDAGGDSANLGGLNAAFADGAVLFLEDQREKNLRALMTRKGREPVKVEY